MDPFLTLLDIETHCRENATTIPRQLETERDWVGVGFKLSNFNFVCPMSMVSEVLRWPAITNLPGAVPWFKGTVNLRGRLLPVTDLQGFVSGTLEVETTASRVLVIRIGQEHYGFSVSEVLGIQRFFSAEVKSVESLMEMKDYLPYASGAFERDNQPWVILNFEKITEMPDFYHIVVRDA